MDSLAGDDPFFPRLYEWNQEFLTERQICLEDENEPYVAILRRQGQDAQDTSQSEADDTISRFMTGADDHQVDKVTNFYHHINTTTTLGTASTNISHSNSTILPTAGASGPTKCIAFLVDADRAGGQRIHKEALTTTGLHEQLQQPRFKLSNGRTTRRKTAQDRDGQYEGTEENLNSKGEIDADQRLICIRDFDADCLYALAATASKTQSHALQGFIYDYLMRTASIQIVIPPEGVSFYKMEFHFPFYVAKKSKTPLQDPRGLRKVQNISFLSRPFKDSPSSKDSDYLYEGQVSFCISGHDEYLWTAYLIIDRYYEDSEEMESLENYEGLCMESATIPTDPFTGVRLYWLALVEKIESAVTECDNVSGVNRVFADAVRNGDSPNFPPDHYQKKKKADARRDIQRLEQERKEFSKWLIRTKSLLQDILKSLNSILEAWNNFHSGEMRYMSSIGEPDKKNLAAIFREIYEIKKLLGRLRSLEKELREDIPQIIQLCFAREGNESAITQEKTADDVRILTWITFKAILQDLTYMTDPLLELFVPNSTHNAACHNGHNLPFGHPSLNVRRHNKTTSKRIVS
ncbi:hypothetical protein F5Y19DRAFT_493424 [Xylariaceae sp. FL1651]|nr:hypothetical protein F5Y19DRAFT_493424 [Xylariaceae sp. FL1651]